MQKTFFGSCLLFIGAIVWGFAVVAQVTSMDSVSPLFFNAIRFSLGSLVLLPVIIIRRSIQRRSNTLPPLPQQFSNQQERRKTYILVCSLGIVLFFANVAQQYGVALSRQAGKTGFITALYIVFVPILAFILFRTITPPITWIAVIVAMVGFYILCTPQGIQNISLGDGLILVSAIIFAGQILIIDYITPRIRPLTIAFWQTTVTAILSWIAAALTGTITWSGIAVAWPAIAYAGILSVGVGYTLQVIGQHSVPAAPAAIIMSTESIFSAIGGAIFLQEHMTWLGYTGCVLIFIGTLLAQLPSLLQK